MTWTSRIRLLVGTLVVLMIAAWATYQLNETRGIATSNSAQILAKTYVVGTPYSGLVVDQKVDVGDQVKTGEPLFVLDSASLQYDIKNGFARQATEATQIDEAGRLVILATGDGTVRKVSSERGTFVQSATELATVERAQTLYVQAEYTLTPKEYSRLSEGAAVTVELPNHGTITTKVDRIEVETIAGKAQAVLTMSGDSLKDGGQHGLVSAGTPVTAEVHLRNDGVVTRAADSIKGYLKGIFG